MNCKNCGAELDEGTRFCDKCGTPVEEMAGSAQEEVGMSDKGKKYKSSTGAKGFVSENEGGSFSLKNGWTANIIAGEGLLREDAIITNRRLYYNYNRGIITKVKKECIIDIDDITGTEITDIQPRGCIVLAVLSFILLLIFALMDGEGSFIGAGLGLAAFFTFLYFICKQAFLVVQYAGGSIRFSVKFYGLNNVRAFQRRIYFEKDHNKHLI